MDPAPTAGLNLVQSKSEWWSKDTVAVVTGSNKGLGQEIVLSFARHGVTVVSTARDPHRGLASVESAVKAEPELAGLIHFHQLDITNEQSVEEFAAWLKSTFGGIDILINNAGLSKPDAAETFGANYYGTKRVTEKLLPLMRASPHGARIVMISAQLALLEHFASNEYITAKVAEAVDHLDKGMVDSLAAEYLEDVKGERALGEKWTFPQDYKESKLFLNTYTRILAGELASRPEGQRMFVNALDPGLFPSDMAEGNKAGLDPEFVKQFIAKYASMIITAAEAAAAPVWLALLPKDDYPHGQYFIKHKQNSTF